MTIISRVFGSVPAMVTKNNSSHWNRFCGRQLGTLNYRGITEPKFHTPGYSVRLPQTNTMEDITPRTEGTKTPYCPDLLYCHTDTSFVSHGFVSPTFALPFAGAFAPYFSPLLFSRTGGFIEFNRFCCCHTKKLGFWMFLTLWF